MILYLDTSSLVKLYVEEKGSGQVAEMVDRAEVSATSMIAYAEARAAFARRFREASISSKDYKKLRRGFASDWQNFLSIHVTDALVRLAGNLAEKHRLRGFDAVHLASALTLKEKLATAITFSCFDTVLQDASRREQLTQPS
ncbi:MAG: type II toxin-antitoxin system VapC family toxin [Pseudomonadota bacterium]